MSASSKISHSLPGPPSLQRVTPAFASLPRVLAEKHAASALHNASASARAPPLCPSPVRHISMVPLPLCWEGMPAQTPIYEVGAAAAAKAYANTRLVLPWRLEL
ncbi:hypothetical protein GGX14DRAFT_566599 [Mycena pura]|uniref:Uncharacterized protein n=1 Tax=Mycena pura TaxID=153505 RepID=A0AAD6VCT3_9AGAR|nr:hypothetical protein GGX14DRAFT_566599 [Mycena pura]